MRKKRWGAPEIAELCGVSERHIHRLVGQGVLPGAGPDGFDPVAVAGAFIRHIGKDGESRQARVELAKVEAARKRLQLRRHLGHLFSPDEFVQASDRQFELQWEGWMRGGNWLFG